MEISSELGQPAAEFVVAGGEYNDEIKFQNNDAIISILENVTLNGRIYIDRNSKIFIQSDDNTKQLTINSEASRPFQAIENSVLRVDVPLICNTNNAESCFVTHRNSLVSFTSTVTFNVSGTTSNILFVERDSYVFFGGLVTVSGNGKSAYVGSFRDSKARFNGGLTVNANICYRFIMAYHSFIEFDASDVSVNLIGGSNYSSSFEIIHDSHIWITQNITSFSIYVQQLRANGSIWITSDSTVRIDGSACNLSLSVGSGSFSSFINPRENSDFTVACKSMTLTGTVGSGSIVVDFMSTVYIGAGVTIPTNTVTGRRFQMAGVSEIWTAGAGENRLPGTEAGYKYPNHYTLYR